MQGFQHCVKFSTKLFYFENVFFQINPNSRDYQNLDNTIKLKIITYFKMNFESSKNQVLLFLDRKYAAQ